jgi:hypothetical protein
MATRQLKFSPRKNDIYDRSGLFMTRAEEAGHTRADRNDWSAMDLVHYLRARVCITLADTVYLYRDLYKPQRPARQ